MTGPAPAGTTRFTLAAEWPALAAIAGVFALGWMLVSPWRNVPIIDDWVYAWSVEHLLKTGELRVSDYSSIYPVAQILWGALFAALAGFSFGILRLSTVVLAVLGCWAIYLTLRELGVDAVVSLLAALTVALYPVYFSLAFTFMTDVPFVSLSSIALFFYVSALVRSQPERLWWGSAVALLAFLVRPLALVLPLSAFAGLARGATSFSRRERGSAVRLQRGWHRELLGLPVLPLVAALLIMTVLWIVMPHLFGRLPVADQRVEGLGYLSFVSPKVYAEWDIHLPFIVAFPFAPLLMASLASGRRAAVIAAVSVVLIVGLRVTLGELPTPLPDWQTWSLQDLATRGGLFGGDLQPSAWSLRLMPLLRVVGTIAVSSLLVALIAARHGRPAATRVVLVLGLLHVVLFNLLWFFNDRYYLVLVPTMAYLAAAPLVQAPWNRRVLWIAAPLLAVWAFVSVTGTRDMLATNDAVAGLARELEAEGVPPSQIDAGYTLNGWRLYVHPENLPPGADRRYDVPFVTSAAPTRYRIVNVAGPGEEVLRVVPLPAAWWQVTDRVYVVRRRLDR